MVNSKLQKLTWGDASLLTLAFPYLVFYADDLHLVQPGKEEEKGKRQN